MSQWTFAAKDETDTMRLGRALAEALPPGTTVALLGTLGAGKTRLVQAMADACGIPRETVNSPTFVICQEYHGRRSLYHMDAYRIKDDDEFLELGPEEYFESDGITLIEWADRVADCLPRDYLEIRIEITGECERLFYVQGHGSRCEAVVEELSKIVQR